MNKLITLPEELRKEFERIKDSLFNKGEKAISKASTQDIMNLAIRGQALNEEAKVIDWMLSFQMPSKERHHLIEVVKYMGFTSLAGVLSGQASTGITEVKFNDETGELELIGSRCKQGWIAAKKIPGTKLPFGRSRTISTLARNHEKFQELVYEFWPIIKEGQMEETITKTKSWMENHKPPAAPDEKTAIIRKRSNDFQTSFKWITGITDKVVEEIKTINWKDRTYDNSSKVWSFKNEYLDKVRETLEKGYTIVVQESGEATPSDIYKGVSKFSKPYNKFSGRY